MNILNLCLSYSGMTYDTLPFLGERLPRNKLDFRFLFNVSRFRRSILAIATCVICFTRKISRVHRSVVMKNSSAAHASRETLCLRSKEYHMHGTRSAETNIYFSGTHINVEGI